MNHREVMQQALEALEAVHPYTDSLICYASTIEQHPPNAIDGKVGKAITALRAALAEPEQEPGAIKHMMRWVDALKRMSDNGQHMKIPGMNAGACWELAIELEQFLYTHPPQRKPLTDEEIDALPWGPHEGNPVTFAEGLRDFARAIERAHGIKQEEA